MKKSTWFKKGILLAVVGAMLLSMVACGGSASSGAASPTTSGSIAASAPAGASSKAASSDGVTLEFQQWWAVEAPEGYVQAICDKFYEETGITVNLLSAPFADTKTQIVSGASTGTVADIVSVDSSWVYDFADQGLLTDLTALMEADGFDQALTADQWKVNGAAYAIPIVNFAYPLFVNQGILEESGVTELPKTWSEFEAVCQKIVDAGFYPIALNLDTSSPSGIQNVYMGMAWASGINMKDADGNYKIAGNEDLKEYAEWMKGLYDKGYIYPGMASLKEADMTSKFAAGEIAFIVNSAAAISTWRKEAPELNLGAAPVPVRDDYTGESGMCVASWAVGITENSEHKAEAMKFVEYLLAGLNGDDGSIDADLAKTMSAFPGSTIAEPDYSGADPVFQDIYTNYATGYPINEFTGMKEANTVMTDFINALIPYMEGDTDVDSYLQQVQDAVDAVYAG